MNKQKDANPVEKLFKPNKNAFNHKLAEAILPAVEKVLGKRGVKAGDISWEHPLRQAQGKLDHGDYSANIALKLVKRSKGSRVQGPAQKKLNPKSYALNPNGLAQAIMNEWRSQGLPDFVGKVEVAPPGFINVWLKTETLGKELGRVLGQKEKYGQLDLLKGRKILLEHTSPNPQTTIMLGHLRNNFLGMAVSRLWEAQGAKVVKDCIVNDRGVHICRAMWGYLVFGRKRGGLTKKELLGFRNIEGKRFEEMLANIHPGGAPSGHPARKPLAPGVGEALRHTGGSRMDSPGVGVNKALTPGVDFVWQALIAEWQAKKSAWYQPKDLGLKPDHANLRWYVLGSRAYKEFAEVKDQVQQILVAWEGVTPSYAREGVTPQAVRALWKQILDWSDKGYAETYGRIGSIHDKYWYESDHWREGKKFVNKGLKTGVFRKSEGAVVTDLAKYGLSDTVVQKADGTALYLTQDLALTKLKVTSFPSDLYIWDIGNEQKLYLEQMYAVCGELGIAPREKLYHLGYALINFKGKGKMATRTGNVVTADEILDLLYERALETIKGSNQELRGKLSAAQLEKLAEEVALGAVKYSLLRYSRETTMQFDIDESLALEGNSGPYLQYTFARCQSVLARAKNPKSEFLLQRRISLWLINPKQIQNPKFQIQNEEVAILRVLYQFPEVVGEAAKNFAPNLVANYLYDLAQKFNAFYNKHSILNPEARSLTSKVKGAPTLEVKEIKAFRLALTAAVGQILQNGLRLLGIETPRKM